MSDKKDTLISDSGIIESNKSKQTLRFVLLCDILAVALAILGIVAFVMSNF